MRLYHKEVYFPTGRDLKPCFIAMTKILRVRSLAEVNEASSNQIATACNIPASAIEDIYSRTPLQLSMISETQPYDSQLGILQVVVGEEHVSATEDRAEDVEAYFQQDQITPIHTRSVFGVPLFRSARFDRVLVVTMNHAIMAYWSIT